MTETLLSPYKLRVAGSFPAPPTSRIPINPVTCALRIAYRNTPEGHGESQTETLEALFAALVALRPIDRGGPTSVSQHLFRLIALSDSGHPSANEVAP